MILSSLALLVSLSALGLGVVNHRRAKSLDERDLFLRLHESLLSPELVQGRRVLYKIESLARADLLSGDEQTAVYRVLAMYDVLGLYVENGWISRETVLAEWGDSLRKSDIPGNLFLEVRRRKRLSPGWPHWRGLVDDAKLAGDDRRD